MLFTAHILVKLYKILHLFLFHEQTRLGLPFADVVFSPVTSVLYCMLSNTVSPSTELFAIAGIRKNSPGLSFCLQAYLFLFLCLKCLLSPMRFSLNNISLLTYLRELGMVYIFGEVRWYVQFVCKQITSVCFFVNKRTKTNFRFHDEQMVNGLSKIAWASVFHLPCLYPRLFMSMSHVYVSMFPCLHLHVSMFPEWKIKMKIENGTIHQGHNSHDNYNGHHSHQEHHGHQSKRASQTLRSSRSTWTSPSSRNSWASRYQEHNLHHENCSHQEHNRHIFRRQNITKRRPSWTSQ